MKRKRRNKGYEVGVSETKKALVSGIERLVKLSRTARVGEKLLTSEVVRRDKVRMPPVHSQNHRQMNRNKTAGN